MKENILRAIQTYGGEVSEERAAYLATACSLIADEFAERFAEWTYKENWKFMTDKKWHNMVDNTLTPLSTSDLLVLFQQPL